MQIGQIVHYFVKIGPNELRTYPAIITHVWSDECANLFLVDDGSLPLRGGAHTETSVHRGQTDNTWD